MTDRTLPHAMDAEKAVLGAAMLHETALATAMSALRPEDFFRDAHRRVFAAMLALAAASSAVDLLTLRHHLTASGELDEVGGATYLSGLTDGIPRASNVEHYAAIVREQARLRATIGVASWLAGAAYDREGTAAALADEASRRLATAVPPPAEGMADAGPEMRGYVDALVSGTLKPLVPTGFRDLDRRIGGLRVGDMAIVAARPSVGKTSFALRVAEGLALREPAVPSAFLSLEVKRRRLVATMLAWHSGVSALDTERGEASPEDYARVYEAAGALDGRPLFLNDSARTVTEMWAWCRRLKAERGLGCAVVDYLQLFTPAEEEESRQQEVARMSRTLKHLAVDVDIALVVLSQLSRAVEGRSDRRPHLGDLRESGALEQDADLVLLLYRPEMHSKKPEHEGVAECIVAKNRSGPTGVIRLQFEKRLARFSDLAQEGL